MEGTWVPAKQVEEGHLRPETLFCWVKIVTNAEFIVIAPSVTVTNIDKVSLLV